MEKDFLCPKCRNYLMVNQYIIFKAKTIHNKEGIVLLSPKIGDYQVIKHPTMSIRDGEKISFYCPMCGEDLSAKSINNNLAKVIMLENNKEYEILFSEIAGEHCTYKVFNEKIEKYGDDSDEYINHFGISPEY